MTWISLICLLALTSSALGRSAYGGSYGSPSLPKVLPMVRENLPRSQGYGQPSTAEWSTPLAPQQDETPLPQISVGNYGAKTFIPKTFPTQGYGQMPFVPQFEQPAPVEVILTPADILCRGQAPETVIPIEDGAKFVTCLDESKGVEQACPRGLIYQLSTRRCERRLPASNPCALQPCLNGGQCIQTEYSFQCQCAPGFDGETCELDATVCQTQNPCGQAPGTRCQSFRWGAALKYVCIFQDGEAYGFNGQQVIPNPCATVGEGTLALTGHQGGFIMCDSERMFVEACPGGTNWDDSTKACVWEGMEGGAQLEQRSTGYGQSYGQSYSQPKTLSYGQSSYTHPRLIHKSTYGGQITVPRMVNSGYGAQISVPKQLESGYGAQISVPKQLESGYGAQISVPKQLESGYGAQISVPKQLESGYGAQISVPRQVHHHHMSAPKQFEGGYGGQISVPKQLESGYGAQISVPKQLESGYGAQISVPRQVHIPHISAPKQFEGGYGGQISAPKQLESGYGAQISVPKFVQPTYGGRQEDQLVTVKQTAPTY